MAQKKPKAAPDGRKIEPSPRYAGATAEKIAKALLKPVKGAKRGSGERPDHGRKHRA